MIKKIILFIALIIIILAGFLFIFYKKYGLNFKNSEKKEIWIGTNKIKVEIADEESKRIRGLSGREFLGENEGMLFIFKNKDFHRFWMKDMKIPLDFIWIQENRIVDIMENVLPPKNSTDKLSVYFPKEPIDKVLEVNAGWSKKNNIKIGDKVNISGL